MPFRLFLPIHKGWMALLEFIDCTSNVLWSKVNYINVVFNLISNALQVLLNNSCFWLCIFPVFLRLQIQSLAFAVNFAYFLSFFLSKSFGDSHSTLLLNLVQIDWLSIVEERRPCTFVRLQDLIFPSKCLSCDRSSSYWSCLCWGSGSSFISIGKYWSFAFRSSWFFLFVLAENLLQFLHFLKDIILSVETCCLNQLLEKGISEELFIPCSKNTYCFLVQTDVLLSLSKQRGSFWGWG